MSITMKTLAGEITFPNVSFDLEPGSSLHKVYKDSDLATNSELYNALPLRQRVRIQISNPKIQGVTYIFLSYLLGSAAGVTIALLALLTGFSAAMITPAILGVFALTLLIYGLCQLTK